MIPFLMLLKHFSQHTSVLKIKQARNSPDCFSFKLVIIEDICRKILALDALKVTQSEDMAIKISKNNSDIFSSKL